MCVSLHVMDTRDIYYKFLLPNRNRFMEEHFNSEAKQLIRQNSRAQFQALQFKEAFRVDPTICDLMWIHVLKSVFTLFIYYGVLCS